MIKEFKISCHALCEIMAGEVGLTETQNARFNELFLRRQGEGKPLTDNMNKELDLLIYKKENPELPKGAKTHCKTWLKRKLYNRDPFWKAIVVDKGLMCETDGIKLIAEIFQYENFEKNDEFFENDYIQGSPDVLHNEIVRDTKMSWDLFSFPMFDEVLEKQDYWYQLQGYMIITGFKKASLDYVLIDTPKSLVALDLKKLYYQSGGVAEDWTPEKHDYLLPNYRFDDIPKEKRIKSFTFTLDAGIEQKIIERVKLCRIYIEKISK